MRTNLQALTREIRAVRLAIEALDEGAAEEKAEAGDIDEKPPKSNSASSSGTIARSESSHDDKGLQRAGLSQRLSDLKARKKQLKV